jgi:putative peptidoglycan lipid II flippase
MNAPYDGERGQEGQDPGDGSAPPEDPYVRDAYTRDPYQDRDPVAQDPVNDAVYDGVSHPPPPGSIPDPGNLYRQPDPGPHAPDPNRRAPTSAPEPEGPSRRLPYGDDPSTVQFTGIDGLLSGAPDATQANPRASTSASPSVPDAPGAPRPPAPRQSAPSTPPAPFAQEREGTAAAGEQHTPEAGRHTGHVPQPSQSQSDAFAHLFRDQGHEAESGAGRSAEQGEPRSPRPQQPQQRPPQGQGPYQPSAGPPPPRPEGSPATPAHQPPGAATPFTTAQPTPGAPGAPGENISVAPTPPPHSAAGAPAPAGSGGIDTGSGPNANPNPKPGRGGGGKAGGLLRSSAIMAAGTMVSRLTGFIRSAMIVAALGAAVLGDTYQTAITLPTMLYVLTVGGGLNSVFVPQLVRSMKEDEDGGEAYANRLLTVVVVILGALTVVAVLAAPLLVRVMSVTIARDPAANAVAVTFVRYCLPSIFFMGIHVVMGQVLNARGRFGAMMWTPVLNNIVIMATVGAFLWVYGSAANSHLSVESIPPEGVRLLGVGTLLGLVVQSLAMIPYLRATGFKIRPRFDWRGHGLGKAAKLAKWTILFVLANQAGNLVVIQLSTWAGASAASHGHPGTGYTAYSQAQLIWNMPQAIITVSVMAALLPRISRAASDGDTGAVRDDISQGLRNSAVAIVPIAFGFLALGIPLCTMVYGSSGIEDARSMGQALMAFGIGLIPFSIQYVVLRAFYAYEDTRTPFYNTVIIAAVNAAASVLCFLLLPERWAVVGMAASYGLAYVIGVGIAWRRLRLRLGGDLDGSRVVRTYIRLAGAAVPATAVAGAVVYGITQGLGSGPLGSVSSVLAGGIALGVVFVLAAKRMRIAEMTAMVGMVRARLGR